MSDRIWLQGGPYYELSFLFKNPSDKGRFLNNVIDLLKASNAHLQLFEDDTSLLEKQNIFIVGHLDDETPYQSIDLNIELTIGGIRRARLFICVLSNELIKLNFWFYGSNYDVPEWNQIGLRKEHKSQFKEFFSMITRDLKPILGTIGYEEDCSAVFDTQTTWPSPAFSSQALDLQKIQAIILGGDSFEYGWIKGDAFRLKEDIEIEKEWMGDWELQD